MSTTLAEFIAQNRAKCDAMEAALKVYPDAYISGERVVSPSLKAEDCDHVECDVDTIRVGRRIDGFLVLMPYATTSTLVLLWSLERKDPETYQKLVRMVAK